MSKTEEAWMGVVEYSVASEIYKRVRAAGNIELRY